MEPTTNKNPIIRLFNVSKRYNGKLALKDINLEIEQGDFVAIMGASGATRTARTPPRTGTGPKVADRGACWRW